MGPLLTSSPIVIGKKKKKKKKKHNTSNTLQFFLSLKFEILHHRLPVFTHINIYWLAW